MEVEEGYGGAGRGWGFLKRGNEGNKARQGERIF
jgi:hypothetical protein